MAVNFQVKNRNNLKKNNVLIFSKFDIKLEFEHNIV